MAEGNPGRLAVFDAIAEAAAQLRESEMSDLAVNIRNEIVDAFK